MEKRDKRGKSADAEISELEYKIHLRLRYLSSVTGYPIFNLKFLRKVGPPLTGLATPERGSEIFAHRLPVDALEDELFWYFSQGGKIYDMRLMLRPSGVANRGFAFIRYCNPEQARFAIDKLSDVDFRPNHRIFLEKSLENNRLFVSGLPLTKTKEEIWKELENVGMHGIVDVIVYKSYRQYYRNRGFIFIEFSTHEIAATIRKTYVDNLKMWDQPVILDWAEPLKEIDPNIMSKVTRLFLRNLNSRMSKESFVNLLDDILDLNTVEKVYKNMDYCFIHFRNREMAERGMSLLKDHFEDSDVEITWSKPPPNGEGKRNLKNLPPRLTPKANVREHESPLRNGEMQQRRRLSSLESAENYDNPIAANDDLNNNTICSINSLLNQGVLKEWNVWEDDRLELDIFKKAKEQHKEKLSWVEECEKSQYSTLYDLSYNIRKQPVRRSLFTKDDDVDFDFDFDLKFNEKMDLRDD